jgi:hypothetical protein
MITVRFLLLLIVEVTPQVSTKLCCCEHIVQVESEGWKESAGRRMYVASPDVWLGNTSQRDARQHCRQAYYHSKSSEPFSSENVLSAFIIFDFRWKNNVVGQNQMLNWMLDTTFLYLNRQRSYFNPWWNETSISRNEMGKNCNMYSTPLLRSIGLYQLRPLGRISAAFDGDRL